MNAKKFLLVIAGCLIFSQVEASGVWTPKTTVDIVYPYDDGSVYVYLADTSTNPAGCKHSSLLRVSEDNIGIDRIYSAFLAALTAGKSVTVYVDKTQCSLGGRYIVAKFVRLYK